MGERETRFWEFPQNNSGGCFDGDPERGIGCVVIVEAHDAAEANARAEMIGLYFNGCNEGMDCPCCGDRWSEAWGDGDEVPSHYRSPVTPENGPGWELPAFIHYLDGRVERIDAPKAQP